MNKEPMIPLFYLELMLDKLNKDISRNYGNGSTIRVSVEEFTNMLNNQFKEYDIEFNTKHIIMEK